MFNRKQLIYIGIAVVLSTVILLLFRVPESGPLEIDESVARIIPQEADERVWLEDAYQDTFSTSVSFYEPGLMKFYDDYLYVSDLSDMMVKRVSLGGQLINTIGKGPGRGPGEINSINGYTEDGDYIWIFDHRLKRASKFSKDGEFVTSLVVKEPMGIGAFDSTLIFKNPMSQEPFAAYNYDAQQVRTFGRFVANQTDHALSISGTFYKHENTLYYLASMASYLIRFNSEYVPSLIQLIDKTPFPTMEDARKPTGQVQMFAPDPDIRMRDVSFDGNKAYVFSYERKENGFDKRMDQYELPSGKYLKSIPLPSNTSRALIKDGMLYTLTGSTIIYYKIKF